MARHFSETLVALAGGRPEVLAVVPGARTKFVAMGAVVLATAALAALSAGFAANMALNATLPVAVTIGVLWGVVILLIDRALVVGMGNQPALGRNLAMAAPRVVLALILGTVISTPLTLHIFHPEIDTEIKTIQREEADDFNKRLKADDRFIVIPSLEQQVADAKARVVSDGGADPVVKDKQAAYDAAYAEYLRLQQSAQCELDGTCGTGRAGVAEAYRNAQAAADRQRAVADAARNERDAAAAASKGQAEKDLADTEEQLDELVRQRDQLQAEFDARNTDNSGLLIRLDALHRIGERDALLGWAHLLLWAMFTCIELLPVLIKLLMNMGASSAYDRVQQNQDNGDADVFDDQMLAWKDLQTARAQVGLDIETDRLEREKQRGIDINKTVFEVEADVIKDTLAVWSAQARMRARDQLAAYESELAQQQPAAAPTVRLHTTAGSAPATTAGAPQPARNGASTNRYLQTGQLPDGGML
ncbi:DUF4407 domain-containing protein [Mycolicibacterium vanbaalenii]|uniref:DUF4407 domain-containing protein n=1 Tax=Mycolicibacterium vanbaalenii (strain DSM 7251 / JCM 13017 / BCRC 16820 / KCTC 9966 / NRRL B-24157 / PYR-1) TaxID=350058 RepID=A1THU4_MYCVP|nr:DUF4407 domain-containing protein [Mycolicibacterium vanbaalenii]ABM16744.1 hypothetical protein Mvan_5988 [Mycolicibacterium vanbaalenii PYR-1]MCV7128332.1 DUF4407 domain-containing protein [Mycolicibacterium vanbaalenii PYR-1]